jgi:hypothetical protein
MSFYVYEWEQPRRGTKLTCGHKPTGKAYKVILSVCQADLMVLPQAIEAALQAKPANPSLLYRFWQWCFAKKAKKPLPSVKEQRHSYPERTVNPMSQVKRYTVKAKDGLQLDCGHQATAGSLLYVTSVYHCAQEKDWPLTILMACFQVLQQDQAAPQPKPVKKIQATNVYTYTYTNGYHQPHA